MPYMHMLSDPGMNYTLNRPLLDGTVAPQIKDYESWHAVWLRLAKTCRSRKTVDRCRLVLPWRGEGAEQHCQVGN